MMPFVYTQTDYWTVENGKIGVAFNTAGWREGLRYTRRLIDAGLLSRLSFTQDRAQMTAMVSPDPLKVGAFVGISGSLFGAKDVKRGEFVILPPLKGPTGRREQFRSPALPRVAMVITKNCKTPESAFMLGDLMCAEDLSLWTRWGRKGIDWEVPTATDKSIYESLGYKAMIKVTSTAWGNLQNIWWAQTGPHIIDARYPAGQVATPSPYDHNAPLGRSIGPQIEFGAKNFVVGLIYNEKEQETITELHNTILTYVRESFARFAVGDLSLDADWDKYVAEFKKMGLDKVIAATQSAYDRMNKK
jgi:putative aldouronate transport system substrate-binding protein